VKYSRFEELPVWKAAVELAKQTYALTAMPAFARQGSLRDQLERATISISNNIAEGFERGTKEELLTFLYIARGSAGEVRSMLCVMEAPPGFADWKFEISSLKSAAEGISRQLRGWAESLQTSAIPGPRDLNDKARKISQRARWKRDVAGADSNPRQERVAAEKVV
jgi:four helix bundle protein